MLQWSQIDPDAKRNSTLECSDTEAWAPVSDLKTKLDIPVYGTVCELNQTLLDENQAVFPSDPSVVKWGLFSRTVSGVEGIFDNPPVLDVSFSSPVNSNGVTLYFYDCYPQSIQIVWYRSDMELARGIFAPDAMTYCANKIVRGYDRVVITFLKTLPYRRLKLIGLEYGQIKVITDKEIIKYSITENVNKCSTKMVVNTASLEIFAIGTEFDIVTNAGDYDLMKVKQPIRDIEGYGTFYTKKISAENSTLSFELSDLLDTVGDVKFYGGLYDTTFGVFIDELALVAGIHNIFIDGQSGFDVSDDVSGIPLKGYIPVTTIRDALQMACIACCVICDTSRSEKIRLYRSHNQKKEDISESIILQGDKTELSNFYTGVTVIAYTYAKERSIEDIFSAEYDIGDYTVEFDAPYELTSLSGGTIIKSGHNFVTFSVATNGSTVSATGYPFVVTEQEYTELLPDANLNIENTKRVEKNTLINPDNMISVAQNYLDYYSYQYKSEYTTLMPYTTGEIYQANRITGILEKQSIDRITGLSKAVLYGNYIPDNGSNRE